MTQDGNIHMVRALPKYRKMHAHNALLFAICKFACPTQGAMSLFYDSTRYPLKLKQ